MLKFGGCAFVGSLRLLLNPGPAVILALVPHLSEVLMHSTSPTTKWTPYEVTAAAITYERRTEDLQLEQLRVRLQKKMQEAEVRESSPAAA